MYTSWGLPKPWFTVGKLSILKPYETLLSTGFPVFLLQDPSHTSIFKRSFFFKKQKNSQNRISPEIIILQPRPQRGTHGLSNDGRAHSGLVAWLHVFFLKRKRWYPPGSNYSDLTRPHAKWWLVMDISLFQGNLGW